MKWPIQWHKASRLHMVGVEKYLSSVIKKNVFSNCGQTDLCWVLPSLGCCIKIRGGAVVRGEKAMLSSQLFWFHLCEHFHHNGHNFKILMEIKWGYKGATSRQESKVPGWWRTMLANGGTWQDIIILIIITTFTIPPIGIMGNHQELQLGQCYWPITWIFAPQRS